MRSTECDGVEMKKSRPKILREAEGGGEMEASSSSITTG